jgi:hypothetical protein
MTIYFMGGEMPSFIPSNSLASEDTTNNPLRYDTSFSRCAFRPGQSPGTYALVIPGVVR